MRVKPIDEGVDFLHYISVTEDSRYSTRYKRFTKRLFDGLVDRLMPELAHVLRPETISKVYGSKKPEEKTPFREMARSSL